MTELRKTLRNRILETSRDREVLLRIMAEAYLEQYPDDGLIWALYADALISLGCLAEARTALLTARGLTQNEATKVAVIGFMADLERQAGDYASAERLYREAAALDPDKGKWQLYVGVTLRHQGRDDEAEACYRTALTLEGERDEYLLNLGYVLQARGDLTGAAACFEEALVIDPAYAEARHCLDDVRSALAFLSESSQ